MEVRKHTPEIVGVVLFVAIIAGIAALNGCSDRRTTNNITTAPAIADPAPETPPDTVECKNPRHHHHRGHGRGYKK